MDDLGRYPSRSLAGRTLGGRLRVRASMPAAAQVRPSRGVVGCKRAKNCNLDELTQSRRLRRHIHPATLLVPCGGWATRVAFAKAHRVSPSKHSRKPQERRRNRPKCSCLECQSKPGARCRTVRQMRRIRLLGQHASTIDESQSCNLLLIRAGHTNGARRARAQRPQRLTAGARQRATQLFADRRPRIAAPGNPMPSRRAHHARSGRALRAPGLPRRAGPAPCW